MSGILLRKESHVFQFGGPTILLFFNRVSKKHKYKNKHKPIKTTQSFTFLQVGQALHNKVCMLCILEKS
jgi:hypothetical protein